MTAVRTNLHLEGTDVGCNEACEPARLSGPERISLREIRSEDWQSLQRFHSRLTAETIHARFHGMKITLTEPLAHGLTELDGHDRVAVVATRADGRIVGVARYARLGNQVAEVAFVVEDEYQGRGIGKKLMQRLIRKASSNGIDRFVATVYPDNVRMLRLLQAVGRCDIQASDGELDVLVSLHEMDGRA